MPTLMLRGLSADLMARIRAHAARLGLRPREAAERLLAQGLDLAESRAAGARAVNQRLTPAQRTAAAHKAWHTKRARQEHD